MKAHLLLTTLGVMCSAVSVSAMDKKPVELKKSAPAMRSYLGFTTDKKLYIREYKSENMEFAVAPKEFVGKKLTEAVPLSDKDKKALKNGFKRAREKEETRRVSYSIADAQFLAAIRYVKDKEQYSVKVTQVNAPTAL